MVVRGLARGFGPAAAAASAANRSVGRFPDGADADDTGENLESAVIATVGTAGATMAGAATDVPTPGAPNKSYGKRH